jgi:hypothetical protein
MRWYWLGAYEVSMGRPLIFNHPADDRQAVKQSTDVLMEEIRRQVECSAQRLLDACWSPGTSRRSLST